MLPSAFYCFSPSNKFVGNYIKNSYIVDNQYSKALFDEKTGNLHIVLKPIIIEKNGEKSTHVVEIQHQSLSSGEKQLLILLTQTLLQEKEPFVYIADEPELSLHIEWQHKIINAIKELNPNAQIIVATHSPEIAGQWKTNITNLQNVTDYGS